MQCSRFLIALAFVTPTAPRAVFADVVTDWNEMLTMALRVAGGGPANQPRPAAIIYRRFRCCQRHPPKV